MRPTTLTLKGIIAANPNLFSQLKTPMGVAAEDVIDQIYLDCYGLEVLYPDADYFQWAIGAWSRNRLDVWTRWEATRHYDYVPIHNYDRHEEGTDTRDGKYRDDIVVDHTHDTTINDTTDTTGHTEEKGTNDSTVTTTVGGYNTAASTAPYDKSITDTDTTAEQDVTGHGEGERTENNTAKDTTGADKKEDWTDTHQFYAYGNIGVTSTQELIEQQREIEDFNLVQIIADEFKQRFCLMVY